MKTVKVGRLQLAIFKLSIKLPKTPFTTLLERGLMSSVINHMTYLGALSFPGHPDASNHTETILITTPFAL